MVRRAAQPATSSRDAGDFYRSTLDSLPAQVAVIDDRGTIVAVNAAWSEFSAQNGGGPSTGTGANYFEVCEQAVAAPDGHGSAAAEVAAGLRDLLGGARDELVVEYTCHSPEERRWFIMRAARFAGAGARRVVLQHQDVTAQRRAEADARFRSQLLDAVDAAVIALDPDGRVTAWNRGAELLYGWDSAEALGRLADGMIAPDPAGAAAMTSSLGATGHWEGEQQVRRKDGSCVPAYVRNARLEGPDGRVAGFVGVSVDVSQRLRAERDLRSARDYLRAVTDSMGDGLCTLDEQGRIVFLNPRAEELLGWATADLAGQDVHAVLHHTRPDGSRHHAEDCPLVEARRHRGAARIEDDVLVRRDGRLLPVQQVMTPFETEDGVGGFVVVFSDISERKRKDRDAGRKLRDLEWTERIRHAMDHDRFVLHAQPIVDISTGRTAQHELLIRMLDGDGSTIPPAMFLPVAEHHGLIGEIDRWVIGQGVRLAAAGHTVELNVSAHSLDDPAFSDYVGAALERSGADPALIVFELTETALLRDEEAALRFVAAIAERGCGIALDDFGTGYGGFSYLKRLPVDFLKIDVEFVRDMTSEPASRKLVEAVVSLARDFGIKTVAEGVENTETLALLQNYGVDYAQGYGLGRPAPLEETIYAEGLCP